MGRRARRGGRCSPSSEVRSSRVVLEQFATAPVDRNAGRGARRRDATVARGDGHDPRSLGPKTAVAHEYEAGGLDNAEDSSAQHAGVVRGVPRVDAAGALHGWRRVPVRDLGWRATRRPRFGGRAARAQGRSPDEWLRDRCQRQRAVRYACPPVDCSPCPIPAERPRDERRVRVVGTRACGQVGHVGVGTARAGLSGVTGAGSSGTASSGSGSKMISRRIGPILPAFWHERKFVISITPRGALRRACRASRLYARPTCANGLSSPADSAPAGDT